jgi:antitoxin component YwqK of YwqJK toxin-antitoxin module
MKILSLLIILFSNSVFAYNPGKWSHLDKYVMGLEKNGPKQETVKNAEGKIIYKASYEYDEEGRLIKEVYTDGSGAPDGETVYQYDKNRVISEQLFSKQGLQEKKIFKYNSKGDLKEIIIYNAEGKEILRCIVTYMWNEQVGEGEIKWIKDKESEYFSTKRESATVYNQEIFDTKKKSVANVKYILDSNGKIIKRENVQSNTKRMSEIQYSPDGKISSFNFSVYQENEWKAIKTHELQY